MKRKMKLRCKENYENNNKSKKILIVQEQDSTQTSDIILLAIF